ncbi:alpha/beta fold hydrolase [Nocardioides marmotae]|uniref:Alpha/beta fold hydrolase n=1 Tax=Nocardioides marmotae TaxID=2663857 RepID=A0A6I3JA63_9ACTN|nr:alpha/beta hydrolase [Nocardioides marmotae]MCR6029915.1 alpha/beta fold hydrolase [Gordonia jinghuaiqii]MBC9732871.1 alpha/beta fold hydrolase [Nocardioides marmotae]MTB83985.1 alpha/beta fold hydrolase [Nocardioides marmotae]MTB93545.1 alpha/beta fold hydrolase [Nocardioides marmotae]QKD99915.1 alpha/beta fold hydrolase [Nocardioides marmotae]
MTDTFSEEATSRFVQTPSGRVHYHEHGEGHPVVLLHGSGPGATGWSNFAPTIRELGKEFRCLAVDMPGWGKSDPVSYDERDHARTALEFLDALGIEQAAFVGNSMGGATAVMFAATHQDRTSHLVTMGAGVGGAHLFVPGGGPSEGVRVLQRTYQDPSLENFRDLCRVMTFDPVHASEELVRQRHQAAVDHPEHIANFAAGIGRPRPHLASHAQIAGITAPSLFFHGRDDRVVHYESTLKLVSLVPRSRAVLLADCGHWVQLEHADEFNRTVADFLRHH